MEAPASPPLRDPAGNTRLGGRLVPLLAFAAVVLVATFFVGDTGVYNDDYFLNQRDPVTGEIAGLIMNRPWHLWRPMTRRVLPPLMTTLWNHPWALHAISAALHGLIVYLLYTLLRRFRISPAIAGPCALAFMVYPVHFEAVLWSSIICTLMSVVLVLAIWNTYAWWLRRGDTVAGPLRLLILVSLGVAAWCAAAFNEQPPGALAALPLAVGVLGLAAGSTMAQRARRSAMPVIAVAIALGWYLVGFFKHQMARPVPAAGPRPHHELLARVAELCEKIPGEMVMRDFARGAFSEGLRAMQAHPVTAAVACGLLAALAIAWAIAKPAPFNGEVPAKRGSVGLVVLGLAWAIAAWIPVVAAHSVTSSRLYYVPAIGCAIVIAGLASAARPGRAFGDVPARTVIRPLTRLAFGLLIGSALVIWIGLEANLQHRCDCDRAEIKPIAEVFGPTLEPDSFFFPVRLDSRSVATGSSRFDEYFQPCWTWEFAAGWRVQSALHNRRAFTFQNGLGMGKSLWLSPADPLHQGLFKAKSARPKPDNLLELLPAYRSHGRLINWDHAVFFDTPAAGQTRIYTRLRLHIPGAEPVDVVPRQVALAAALHPLPDLGLDIYPAPAFPTSAPSTRTGPDTASAPHPR